MKFIVALTTLFAVVNAAVRPVQECKQMCHSLKYEMLTMEMCREAKKTLPRPKVGDFCSSAMERGFNDACMALCEEATPVPHIAQACRAAAIEMPRPTVRRWCEHGYRKGYAAATDGLALYFQEAKEAEENQDTPIEHADPVALHRTEEEEQKPAVIVKSVPITLDEDVISLDIHEGESPEDAVAVFCSLYMTEDISGCIRQLLPNVMEAVE